MIQPEIIKEIGNNCQLIPDDDSFICLYGSSVYHPAKIGSDVDLFCAAENPNESLPSPRELTDFIINIHKRYKRKIDEEVPFDTKLIYTFSEVEDAITFGGFEVHGSKLVVPKIQKTAEFLCSREVKLRLAFNALSTPHHFITNNITAADRYSQMAETAATVLAIDLIGDNDFSVRDAVDALLNSRDGETGEMHLGYKADHPQVLKHMRGFVNRVIDDLLAQGHLNRVHEQGLHRTSTFIPVVIMQQALSHKGSIA